MKKMLASLGALSLTTAAVVPIVALINRADDEDLVTKTETFEYRQNIAQLSPTIVNQNQVVYNFSTSTFNSLLEDVWSTYEGFGPTINITSIESNLTNLQTGDQFQEGVDVDQLNLIFSQKDKISMTKHQLVINQNPNLTSGEKSFYINGEFENTDGTTYKNVRMANFAHHFALNSTTEQNLVSSVFSNVFTIDFTFHLSIAWIDKTNEYTDFFVPVHDPVWWSPLQLLEMFNGDVEFGDTFKNSIMNYIFSKTNVRVNSIRFETIHASVLNDLTQTYSLGDLLADFDTEYNTGRIDANTNTFFYTGITSPDAGGTFNILFKFRGPSTE